MGIFATRGRGIPAADPEAGGELSNHVRMGLPPRFEAVGESLASGSDSVAACAVVGRELARDGASLDETLEALRQTSLMVVGRDPSYDDVQALLVAWSESTLAYLHQLSCEDPMTGLASLAHVRSRVAELYRHQRSRGAPAAPVAESHCLVVIDLPTDRHGWTPADVHSDVLTRALRLSRVGEAARTVFNGAETIGRVGPIRVVVLSERDARLGRRVGLLRTLLTGIELDGHSPRVWIEGIPSAEFAAEALLDELARA